MFFLHHMNTDAHVSSKMLTAGALSGARTKNKLKESRRASGREVSRLTGSERIFTCDVVGFTTAAGATICWTEEYSHLIC